jgi:Sulfotransferase domain
MYELIANPSLFAVWERVFDNEAIDWEQVFEGFASTVDFPGVLYYRKLAAAFPQAKVILSIRDGESWYRSMSATIGSPELQERTAQNPDVVRFFAKAAAAAERETGLKLLDQSETDSRKIIARFNAFNEQVKRDIRPERLLIFNVSEGWAPLCNFLRVGVPTTPFPNTNSAAELRANRSRTD